MTDDLNGFRIRLKKLHFILLKEIFESYYINELPYGKWRIWYYCKKTRETVYFRISRHGRRMMIKRKRVRVLDTGDVSSILDFEGPFLRYFKQKLPLKLNRLGELQSPMLKAWLKKHKGQVTKNTTDNRRVMGKC